MPPPPDHPVTDTATVTRTEPVVDTRVADSGEVTGQRPSRGQSRPTINTLVLHDATDSGIAPYAEPFRKAYYDSGRGQGVRTWRQLIAAIARYEEIDRLVLLMHGAPGRLIFGGGGRTEAAEVRDRLARARTTVTRSLVFENCNVMGDPVGAAVMGSRVCAPGAIVGGFTFFALFAPIVMSVPDVDHPDVGQVEEVLEGYRDYWLPGTPRTVREIAASREDTFYIHWYRRQIEHGEDPALPPLRTPGQLRQRAFRKRDEMTARRVTTRDEAEALRSEFESTHPGLRVTVTNVAAVAGAASAGE